MLEKHRMQIEQLAEDNGAMDLLAAYIIKETGKDAALAYDIAYSIYDSVDSAIHCHADDDEYEDDDDE